MTCILTGSFKKPDFNEIEVSPEDILWDKSKIIIQTSNVKGVNQADLKINNKDYALTSKYDGTKNRNIAEVQMRSLETNHLNKTDSSFSNSLAFNLKLNIKGSEQIRFIPIGKTNGSPYNFQLENRQFLWRIFTIQWR